LKHRLVKIIFIFLALIVFAFGAFLIIYNYTPLVDHAVIRIVNSALGENINISYERLEGNLIGTVRLVNVKIKAPNLTAEIPQVLINHSATKLINEEIRIKSLLIDSPLILWKSTSQEGATKDRPSLSTDSLNIQVDLSGFPVLSIQEFIIKNGKMIYSENGIEKNNFVKLSLEASIAIDEQKVQTNLKYIKGYWKEKDISLHQLSFRLLGNKKRVTLNQLIAKIDDNEVYAHGEIELYPKLRFLAFVDTSIVEIELLSKLIPNLPYQTGYIKFFIEYIGIPQKFNGQMFVTGELDSLKFFRINSKYNYDNQKLYLKDLAALTNFGRLGGYVRIDPRGNNQVDLNFANINLKKPSLAEKYTNFDGQLKLDFNTWNLKSISGEGMAHIRDIKFGSIYVDTLFMKLVAQNGFWNLEKNSRLVVQKSSQFFVEGEMSRSRELNVTLRTDNNNLDTLSRRLAFGPIGGLGSLDINIIGPLINPDIFGYVLLDSLVIENNKTYGVEGNFEIIGISQQRKGFFKLEMSSGVVANIELTDGVVDLILDGNTVRLDSVSFYSGDNYITVKGKLDLDNNTLSINLADFIFQYQDYRIFSTDTLRAYLERDSLIIEDFVLYATGEGEIEIRGMYDFSGESGLGVYFNDIQLLPFNQFFQWKYYVEGKVELSLIVSGKHDSLLVEGLADAENLVLSGSRIGDVSSEFSYQTDEIEIEKFQFIHSPESYFSLTGNVTIPAGEFRDESEADLSDLLINLDFKNIQLSDYPFFKDRNYPVDGIFSGNANIRGNIEDFHGKYALQAINLLYQEYQFPSIELEGTIDPGGIVLKEGNVNFMDTHIIMRGVKPLNWNYKKPADILSDRSFELYVTIREDSLNFLNVLLPEVDLITGDISVLLELRGTIESPKISRGSVKIKKGSLYLSKIENPFQNVELTASIENEILIIKNCKMITIAEKRQRNIFESIGEALLSPFKKLLVTSQSEGEIEVKGRIDLSMIDRPSYDLQFKANRVYINYYLENARIFFSSSNLKVIGRDTLNITGDIDIPEGQVDLNLKESEKNLLISTGVRETPPYLRYVLAVSIPGNFYIRSEAFFNSFDMMLMGDLRIIQEPKGLLEMYGNLEIPKGKYFQFEEFNIRNGRIEFVNPKELPVLNIYAEKKKYGNLFQLQVEGNLNNPVKEIRIYDLQNRQDITHLYPETKDQISLLLFGITFNEIGGSAGSVALDKGQEVVSQAIISKIEQEARRFIGLDEIRVESEGGLIDFTNLRLNQRSQNSAISLGKYLMPNLYVEYKTQLGSNDGSNLGNSAAPNVDYEIGNQIYLEYKINRNWSVSSFYARQLYNKFKIDVSWRYSF
jgi:hypothetical protein